MTEMSNIRVFLLGHFEVSIDGRVVPGSVLHKAYELLALILLTPQRRIQRETAAALLWPGSPAEASRKAIRQALWQLHQVIDAEQPAGRRLLTADNDLLAVNPVREVWLDVVDFQEAAADCRRFGLTATDAELAALRRAAALYRGPLLSGYYGDWCRDKRTYFEDLQITLLDRLSVQHEQREELDEAIDSAKAVLEIEPAHERTHRRLMQLYHQNDDRTRALRQYVRCREALERELGVRPSVQTERLCAVIIGRAGDPVPPEPELAAVEGFRLELAAVRRGVEAIGEQLREIRT
jgi:DNA-binding SARP family transcriptional activator